MVCNLFQTYGRRSRFTIDLPQISHDESNDMSHVTNDIEMMAPPRKVFEVVSDLAAWPRYLPHYRWIRVLENHPGNQVVRMACYRSGIPLDWKARFRADAEKLELHFDHLSPFTRGMHVVWHLNPLQNGLTTHVAINHEIEPVIQRWGSLIAERVIAGFLIQHVASQTLRCFARHFSEKKL